MKMKKFLAVVLSFALSFSLAMPTFAQDNTASAAQAVQSEVTEPRTMRTYLQTRIRPKMRLPKL